MDDGTRGLPALPRVVSTSLGLGSALSALEQVQKVKAAAAALEHRLLARVDQLDDSGEVQSNREQVSPILRCAPQTAHGRLAMSTTLVTDLPLTLAALESGRITPGHATTVIDAVAPLDKAQSHKLENRVLRRCEDTSAAEFRARCRRAVIAVDPEGAARRHAEAVKARNITSRSEGNGMGTLRAHLKLDDLARAKQHLNACTDTIDDPDRTRDQIRADVFVDLVTGHGDNFDPGTGRSRAPNQVTIAFPALANLADHAAEMPGEIDGEPAPASLVRELADDPAAWWPPVLVDRDGHVEAVGARTYKPGARLRRLMQLHDRTCQFVGCRRRAVTCEIDHVVAFDYDDPTAGGLTEAGNLHALCKRHHRLKHEAGWSIVRKDGTTHWRSPTGRTYVKPLEPYLDPDPPPFWSCRIRQASVINSVSRGVSTCASRSITSGKPS